MSTYFLLDLFEFPYYFYRIWGELIYVLSIVTSTTLSRRLTMHLSDKFNSSAFKQTFMPNNTTTENSH